MRLGLFVVGTIIAVGCAASAAAAETTGEISAVVAALKDGDLKKLNSFTKGGGAFGEELKPIELSEAIDSVRDCVVSENPPAFIGDVYFDCSRKTGGQIDPCKNGNYSLSYYSKEKYLILIPMKTDGPTCPQYVPSARGSRL